MPRRRPVSCSKTSPGYGPRPTPEEQKKLPVSMLDVVCIDTKNNMIVAIKPKPPFRPVFQVAAPRNESDIRIINEPLNGSSLFLVETGRVELHLNQCFALFS